MNGNIAVERRLVWNRTSQDRRKTELIQVFDNLKELVFAEQKIKQSLYSRKNLLWLGILITALAIIEIFLHPVAPAHGPASYLWSGFHRIRG